MVILSDTDKAIKFLDVNGAMRRVVEAQKLILIAIITKRYILESTKLLTPTLCCTKSRMSTVLSFQNPYVCKNVTTVT